MAVDKQAILYAVASQMNFPDTLIIQDLYQINNLVDSCNLASLQFVLPIGMYDLPLIQGDVTRNECSTATNPYPREWKFHVRWNLCWTR